MDMVKQWCKYLMLGLCAFSTLCAVHAQKLPKSQGTHFGYFGLEFGSARLSSMPNYSPAFPELYSDRRGMATSNYHSRLFTGYSWNRHQVELSMQNLNFRSVFGIRLGDGSTEIAMSTKGAMYLSWGYLYRLVEYKRLRFNIGPHIGWAIAGKSDFGSNISYVSMAEDAQGNILPTIRVQYEELRLKEQFLNFGLRSNLSLALGMKRHFELFFNSSFLYTPKDIRGLAVSYQVDTGPIRRTHSTTNIRNWTFGLGFRQSLVLRRSNS